MSVPIGGVWAMKAGDFQPVNFASTDSALGDALSYAGIGGEVRCGPGDFSISSTKTVPAQCKLYLGAGTYTLSGSAGFSVGNKAELRGAGELATTIVLSNTYSATSSIYNTTQDGTQQSVILDGFLLSCNKAGGAVVTQGILIKALYVGTRMSNVRVINSSGYGINFDGTTNGLGQMLLDNITVTGSNNDNILVAGAVDSIYGVQITSESVAAGKAQFRITRSNPDTASFGHTLLGVHFEGTAACDGLVLDSCASTCVIGIVNDGTNANNVVKITGSVTGSDGAFGSAGHTFRNVVGNYTTIIDDQVAGVTVGNAQGRFVQEYICPVQTNSGGNPLYTGQIVGVQYQRQGIDLASAAALTPGNGNYFVVTGTANVTSISAAARDKGRVIILQFSGTASGTGVTDGSNLKLNGNFVYTPDDTLTLVCDGTNWYEVARSAN